MSKTASYDIGANGDYTDCPGASLWMILKSYRLRSQFLDSKYLENGQMRVCTQGKTFLKVAISFRLVPSDLTLEFGDQKSNSYFDVKYVKNGKNYDVGSMSFTLNDLER